MPAFLEDAQALLAHAEKECGQLYRTASHGEASLLLAARLFIAVRLVNYTVWSEVMTCPQCARQVVFFDEAVDTEADPMAVRDEFPCPGCEVRLTKRSWKPSMETVRDPLLKRNMRRVKRVPVLIKYLVGKKHFTKKPDAEDMALIASVGLDGPAIPAPVRVDQRRTVGRERAAGMTHLHHYYTPRNFLTLARMVAAATGPRRRQLLNLVQSISVRLCSYLTTYQLGKRGNVPMTGTLHVASLLAEANPIKSLEGKLRDFAKVYGTLQQWNYVGCGSSSSLSSIPDASIDYIFIDPPFGDNLNYAQLNLLWEGWLRLRTNVAGGSHRGPGDDRDLAFYQEKLRECLPEFNRVLKPGRWMTVAFHNSKNAVWNAIQTAILEAGFVVADVRTLDKKQGTPKQINGLNAVKQDLVISAYKPTEAFEKQFSLQAGTEKRHLEFRRGPSAASSGLRVQSEPGRGRGRTAKAPAVRPDDRLPRPTGHLGRLVGLGLLRRAAPPLSPNGTDVLPARQVAEYDRRRLEVVEVEQLELFVSDERSAIQWVRRQLSQGPLTFQDLQPLYMKEAQLAWAKNEQPVELREILEQNFVRDDQGRWHVPDTNKDADLEQIRHRVLLKEFQRYQQPRANSSWSAPRRSGRVSRKRGSRPVCDHRGDGQAGAGSDRSGRPSAVAVSRQCPDESRRMK